MKKIIIDLLGSDNGQEELLKGVVNADKNYEYVLLGDKSLCDEYLAGGGVTYTVIETADFVSNEESPMRVIKDGGVSLAKAFDLLKADEDAIGLVTAGSTGAALVGTAFRFGLIKGLLSPVLCCVLIKLDGGEFTLADCGANIDPRPEDILNFALLASAFAKCYSGASSPKAYLLNVGKEKAKGNELYKAAHKLLEVSGLEFCGNLEADRVFTSDADVLIADGFSGNVFLKASESVAIAVKEITASVVKDEDLIKETYEKVDKIFAYNDLAGAVFLGAKKPVIKLHGKANASTVTCGINQVIRCEKGGFSTAFDNIRFAK